VSRKESAADRIRARLANELAPEAQAAAEPRAPEGDAAAARQHFLGSVGQIAGRSIERVPVGHIAPDLRPEMRQPRMLPLPEELAGADVPPIYRELLAELRALGQSLRERQIQPIVVYPAASAEYPAARYCILVGQRRWTAAVIAGLKTLDAVVVEPPAPIERLRLQYRENEEREDFSDMERAWTLAQLRAAMGGDSVAMDEVAAQLGIRRARAYQLRRMLALSPAQQRQAALLRLQETQLRTLLDALHRGLIDGDKVDIIIERLASIAADRAHVAETLAEQPGAQQTVGPRQLGIDAPTVARLVARTLGGPLGAAPDDPPAPVRWYAPLRQSLARATDSIQRAADQAQALDRAERVALQSDLRELQMAISRLVADLTDGAIG
jgi:ParB/RepB/Spo0J family partition protein